jgi:hypothetical protein
MDRRYALVCRSSHTYTDADTGDSYSDTGDPYVDTGDPHPNSRYTHADAGYAHTDGHTHTYLRRRANRSLGF